MSAISILGSEGRCPRELVGTMRCCGVRGIGFRETVSSAGTLFSITVTVGGRHSSLGSCVGIFKCGPGCKMDNIEFPFVRCGPRGFRRELITPRFALPGEEWLGLFSVIGVDVFVRIIKEFRVFPEGGNGGVMWVF